MKDRRGAPRDKTLQRAEILVGDTVQGCRLLDLNDGGARIELAIPLSIPERFTLRLPGGRKVVCERRWMVGLRLGVQILHGASMVGTRSDRAAGLLRQMHALRAEALFTELRSERHFDDPAVGEAAWAAEAALARLGAALFPVAQGAPPPQPAPPSGGLAGAPPAAASSARGIDAMQPATDPSPGVVSAP